VNRLRDRLAAAERRAVELEAENALLANEVAPYRALGGRLTVQCGGCGKNKSIDLSPRAIRERLVDQESDLDHAARIADLASPANQFAAALALAEQREDAEAKARQRERELKAEYFRDGDETRERLRQGPPQPRG